MSSNGAENKTSSRQRPRHQISRSISELSPMRLHRHHHNHGPNSRKERASEQEDQVPYAASPGAPVLFQPRSSLEVPGNRPTDTPHTLSPDQSRRTSVLVPLVDDTVGISHGSGITAGSGTTLYTRKLSKDGELQQERQKAALRASGLKKALVDLSTFSDATIRRLDDTYYSVLEKLGMLQSTIVALRELAGMSEDTSKQFKQESEGIASEITSQIESFGGFKEQESRIESLTSRIHNGKDKVKTLSERLDVVRKRIEGWERADREWQERTRRRLKVIWVIISALLFLMLILLIAAQYLPAGTEVTTRLGNTTGSRIAGEELPGRDRGSVLQPGFRSSVLGTSLNKTSKDSGNVDERLRLFDEL